LLHQTHRAEAALTKHELITPSLSSQSELASPHQTPLVWAGAGNNNHPTHNASARHHALTVPQPCSLMSLTNLCAPWPRVLTFESSPTDIWSHQVSRVCLFFLTPFHQHTRSSIHRSQSILAAPQNTEPAAMMNTSMLVSSTSFLSTVVRKAWPAFTRGLSSSGRRKKLVQ
jgi:hypothetical protein